MISQPLRASIKYIYIIYIYIIYISIDIVDIIYIQYCLKKLETAADIMPPSTPDFRMHLNPNHMTDNIYLYVIDWQKVVLMKGTWKSSTIDGISKSFIIFYKEDWLLFFH